MAWTEADELHEVRQAHRRFKEAVLAALGHSRPWDITVINEAQIVREIEALRSQK